MPVKLIVLWYSEMQYVDSDSEQLAVRDERADHKRDNPTLRIMLQHARMGVTCNTVTRKVTENDASFRNHIHRCHGYSQT